MITRLPIVFACLFVLCACAASSAPARSDPDRSAPEMRVPGIGPGEPTIRVRVVRGAAQLSVSAAKGMDVSTDSGNTYGLRSLSVSRSGEVWAVAGDTKTIKVGAGGFVVRAAQGGTITVDGSPLGGEVRFLPGEGGSGFDVVEHIGVETYLMSVLAKELYPGWEMEAYRAQAVAARSYALHERARRRGLGSAFDVESSVQDQAYGGANTHERARRAALGTRGVVLRHGGDVLRAYYSSTCGGRSASARDVWPVSVGFRFNLSSPIQTSPRQNACSTSPRYRWRAHRDRDTLGARMRAFGAANGLGFGKMGKLQGVRVDERNAHGRPRSYTVTDQSGKEFRAKAEELRNACNYVDAKKGLAAVAKEQFVYSGDMSIAVEGGSVTITGRGFGHGVGLCQFGAQGLARKGWDAHRILRHYYPGAAIVTAYD